MADNSVSVSAKATINEKEQDDTVANVTEIKVRKLNKLTLKAKLNFNVNHFKNWIKQKLRDDEKFYQNEGKQYTPKLSGAHVAITALNEKLCYLIIEKVIERLTKDNTGIYMIKYNDISDMIKIDKELRKNLYAYMDMYDNTLNYKDQYCIDEKCVKAYIDKIFSASIDISNDALNLLIYLLLKTCVRVIDSAYVIMEASKRRSIGSSMINHCVTIHFSGTMQHLIRMKIDETIKLCGREITDKENNAERKQGTDDDTKEDVETIKDVNVSNEIENIEKELDDSDSEDEESKKSKKTSKKNIKQRETVKKQLTDTIEKKGKAKGNNKKK